MPKDDTLLFEDAEILFRNFAGREGKYNKEGEMSFCVLVPPAIAMNLDADGWNIKLLRPSDPEGPERPYMQVAVGFERRPPKIAMITSKGRNDLSEGELPILDWIDIKTVDLIVRGYHWSVNGKGGIKAYLKTFFVTLEEDYLDHKYAHIEEIGSNQLPVAISDRPHYDIEGEAF